MLAGFVGGGSAALGGPEVPLFEDRRPSCFSRSAPGRSQGVPSPVAVSGTGRVLPPAGHPIKAAPSCSSWDPLLGYTPLAVDARGPQEHQEIPFGGSAPPGELRLFLSVGVAPLFPDLPLS